MDKIDTYNEFRPKIKIQVTNSFGKFTVESNENCEHMSKLTNLFRSVALAMGYHQETVNAYLGEFRDEDY